MGLYSSEVFAGAWTEPKGGSYTRLTYNYYSSDTSFDKKMTWAWASSVDRYNRENPDGSPKATSKFTDWNLTFYGEYGLHDRLTVSMCFPYKNLESESTTVVTKTSGIGNVDIGFRFRIDDDTPFGFVSAVQGQVTIPEAYENLDVSIPGNLAIGSGDYAYELRFLLGRGLYDIFGGGYFGLETAYKLRTEDNLGIKPSDEWKFNLEAGFSIKKFSLRLKSDLTLAEGNSTGGGGDASGGTLSPDSDLWNAELSLGYKATQHVGFEYVQATSLMGRSTAHGVTHSVAVYMIY